MAKSTGSGGIGFGGFLTILFITLKLTHVINWSWFWVLSPVLFGAGFFLLIMVITAFIFAAAVVLKK